VRRLVPVLLVVPLLLGLAGDDCAKLRRDLAAAKRESAQLARRLGAAQQRVGELVAVRASAALARRQADALRRDPRAAATPRPCSSAISGGAAAPVPGDIRVPPLTIRFVGEFAGRARARYTPVGGEKAIAVLDPGGEATVVIPEGHRDDAALVYSDPSPAVRFQGCAEGLTAFNGGFVVAGPRCLPLDVYPNGAREPVRVVVSFASGRCENT
jgi:hypothetical protein